MSLDTWKDEFYPRSAHSVTAEESVEHSLQKWVGLKKNNLDKHKIALDMGGYIIRNVIANEDLHYPGHTFRIDSGSCALCWHFNKDQEEDEEEYESDLRDDSKSGCKKCPLAIARDGIPCDRDREDEHLSPWHLWGQEQNPEPMIFWLKKALDVAL